MRIRALVGVAATAVVLYAADWPMPDGNPQRNGWASSEHQLTAANIQQLKVLYKYQTDHQSHGQNSLTTPIISGNLITYLGFKEMLMFGGSSDKVFSVDADLNRLIWEANFPFVAATAAKTGEASGSCGGGLSSPMAMAGSSSNSLHFAALARSTPAASGVAQQHHRDPYFPPLSQSVYPLLPTTLTQLNAAYTVSADGYLHVVNSSTGGDLIPSVRFVQPNAKVTSLNLQDNVVYATTADNCDGFQNALFAIDILSPQKTVRSFILPEGDFAGNAGTSIGNDGTVYVQGAFQKPGNAKHLVEAVVALQPRDLSVKDYFIIGNKPAKTGDAAVTPVAFSFTGRDLIAASGANGKAYLLDSRSLGGADHRTPLFTTSKLAGGKGHGSGLRGVFSTWLDVDTGTRWFYATAFEGSGAKVIALQLKGTSEQPTLESVWRSDEVPAPAPVVIANKMLFVLSTDGALHVLDAATGKAMHSVSVPSGVASGAGLALANGRVYIPGSDNAIYCLGIPSQQTQLEEQ